MWVGMIRPGDRGDVAFTRLDWSSLSPVEDFFFYHIYTYLSLFLSDHWYNFIYKKPQSSAATFRDTCAVLETTAAEDQEIVRPRLNRAPTVSKYMGASRKGDQAKIEDTFANALTICASNRRSLDKYRTILRNPLREETPQALQLRRRNESFHIENGL